MEHGYIYIAGDSFKEKLAKVGKTRRRPTKRISETTNPHYYYYHSYKVELSKLDIVEREIHSFLNKNGCSQVKHQSSNKSSEWFECSPEQADELLARYFKNRETRKINEAKKKRELEELKEKIKPIQEIFEREYLPLYKSLRINVHKWNGYRYKYENQIKDKFTSKKWHFIKLGKSILSLIPAAMILALYISSSGNYWMYVISIWAFFVVVTLIFFSELFITKTIDEESLNDSLKMWTKSTVYNELIGANSDFEKFRSALANSINTRNIPTLPFTSSYLKNLIAKCEHSNPILTLDPLIEKNEITIGEEVEEKGEKSEFKSVVFRLLAIVVVFGVIRLLMALPRLLNQ